MSLDATPAGNTADSYLTVAGADALAGADYGPEVTSWGTADTDTKERALKRATREIDAYLGTGWPRYSATQSLLFPRSVDVVSSLPVIPVGLTRATYQQAIYVVRNAKVLAAAGTRGARNMQSASEPNTSYSEGDGVLVISPLAQHYLTGFQSVPGGRHGSVGSVRMSAGYVSGQ